MRISTSNGPIRSASVPSARARAAASAGAIPRSSSRGAIAVQPGVRNGTGRQRERIVGSRSAGRSLISMMWERGGGSSSVFRIRGAPVCSPSRSAPPMISTRRSATAGRVAIACRPGSSSSSRISAPLALTSVRSRATSVCECRPCGSMIAHAISRAAARLPVPGGPKKSSCCGGLGRSSAARSTRCASG